MGEHTDPGGTVFSQFPAGDNANNPRCGFGGFGINGAELGVRKRAAAKGDMHHARQGHIVDEGAAAFQKPFGARAAYAFADEGVGPIEHREG